jgi:hypothetical protein
MTAIAAGAKRALRKFAFSGLELAAAPSAEYKQGSVVGFDSATPGLVRLGQASATFKPIGTVTESKTLGVGGGSIHVTLFVERFGHWMLQGPDVIGATGIGGSAWLLDDQTVNADDNGGTLSVAGRVWKLHATKGVLVEFAA